MMSVFSFDLNLFYYVFMQHCSPGGHRSVIIARESRDRRMRYLPYFFCYTVCTNIIVGVIFNKIKIDILTIPFKFNRSSGASHVHNSLLENDEFEKFELKLSNKIVKIKDENGAKWTLAMQKKIKKFEFRSH